MNCRDPELQHGQKQGTWPFQPHEGSQAQGARFAASVGLKIVLQEGD